MVIPSRDHDPLSRLLATDLSRRVALDRFGAGLAAVLLAARAGRAAAQETTVGALPPLLEEWVTVWARDPTRVSTLYAADAALKDASSGDVFRGRNEIQAHVAAEFKGFPGHAYEVPAAFVSGDWAAAEWVFTGTYSGAYPGLPPDTGQAVSLRGAALFRIAGGQIQWEAHYYDAYTLLVQLGLLPTPGETEATPSR